jgi:hypothetical protein
MVAMAILLGKALLGDAAIRDRLVHHPLSKNELIPPIEVSLEKAYRA